MTCNKNKKGFSLLEVVMIIAVIGILAGILVPSFNKILDNTNDNKIQRDIQAAYLRYDTDLVDRYNDNPKVTDESVKGKSYAIEKIAFKTGDKNYFNKDGVFKNGYTDTGNLDICLGEYNEYTLYLIK